MADYLERLSEAQRAASKAGDAAYEEVKAPHREWTFTYDGTKPHCKCGREFRNNNGLGLHHGAVDRHAWKAWDAAYEAEMAKHRTMSMRS